VVFRGDGVSKRVQNMIGNSIRTNSLLPSTGTNQFSSAQADAALTLYNGFFTMQVNNQNIVPAWDILRSYFVPQTQGGVGITAQTVFPIDQCLSVNLNQFQKYDCTNNQVTISGASSIEYEILLLLHAKTKRHRDL
jgi:hypothetical protein